MGHLVLLVTIAASGLVCVGLVWGTDLATKRRRCQVRELEKKNLALRANLEVARAKMREITGRRFS
jgi:hypothetical protein